MSQRWSEKKEGNETKRGREMKSELAACPSMTLSMECTTHGKNKRKLPRPEALHVCLYVCVCEREETKSCAQRQY